ncbi:MAG: phospholipase D-like domain-containing protein, partial [Alphaproteobacteria bacterium]
MSQKKSKESAGHDTVRVIVQPDDGVEPIRSLIASATTDLLVKQFTFTEPHLIEAVIERHRQGIPVRVLLNAKNTEGQRANDESYKAFKAAKVPVQWTNERFAVTHEKSLVVDRTKALIATFNLAPKYLSETRDYGVLTEHASQVSDVMACFEADWQRAEFTPRDDTGLLWSVANSREVMSSFIDTAKETLYVQHPKFVDAVILERLVGAQERGVKVHVLCGGKHGIKAHDLLDSMSSLRILGRAGIKLRRQKRPKLHAKLLIADRQRCLLGSMNIHRDAFDRRRELGILSEAPGVVGRLLEIFEGDWHEARHYEAPDPLAMIHDPDELPHDPDFVHG